MLTSECCRQQYETSDVNFLHRPARNFLIEAIRCQWAGCHSYSSGLPSRLSPLMHSVSKDRADIADIDATG